MTPSLEDRMLENRHVLAEIARSERAAASALDQIEAGCEELDRRVHWLNKAAGSLFWIVLFVGLVAGFVGGWAVVLLMD